MTSAEHDESNGGSNGGPTREPRGAAKENADTAEHIDESPDTTHVPDPPALGPQQQPGTLPPGPALQAYARHDPAQPPPQYGTPYGTPPPGPPFAPRSRKSVASCLGPAPDLQEPLFRRLLHRFGRRR